MRKSGPLPLIPQALPPTNYFDDIVINAIDFITVSIKEIESRPKYSVINFCAGLELILKARLLLEHWSLTMSKPETAELSKFRSGDFHSVNMETAVVRLSNICAETFSKEEIACYKTLRDHRNRVVHFCHEAYSKQITDRKLLEQIAAEQCRAWWFLHQRLTGSWGEQFKNHVSPISKLDKALHGLRVFLRTKFEALRVVIEAEIFKGAEYRKCSACGFKSAVIDQEQGPVYMGGCIVCGSNRRFLRLNCTKCKRPSDIENITSATCSNRKCKKAFSLNQVLTQNAPLRESEDEQGPIFPCTECFKESATILGERYFCFSCMQWFDRVDQCGFCGQEWVGFLSVDSAWLGCMLCADAAADHFARD